MDLADGLVDGARGGHDRRVEAPRELPAEVRGVAVVGPDQSDFELDVGEAHDADPGGRDEEMRVGPLVVHVLDAVLGLIVLHPDPGLLVPIQWVPRPVNDS
jgi:hypothetical protein